MGEATRQSFAGSRWSLGCEMGDGGADGMQPGMVVGMRRGWMGQKHTLLEGQIWNGSLIYFPHFPKDLI